MKTHLLACAFITLLFGTVANSQSPSPLPIMPQPAHATLAEGEFPITNNLDVLFSGYTEPRLTAARQRFLSTLTQETGIPFLPDPTSPKILFQITTTSPAKPIQQLGEDESYHLEITPIAANLSAPNPLGILHGLQTFLQLVHITPSGFSVPAVTIDDQPRFPWRGLMIDSGRHFIPLPVLERNLDAMEAVKLNVFHWHLSDDQGFRVESKTFPLLQQKGSDGLFYTQDQIRHIVQYAHDRGIRVVPEFDMPAHASSWFVGYPQLASGKGPYPMQREWGVLDPAMDPTRESTYQFLNLFLTEMTSLFPDAYFHIGGDECNGKEWDANLEIQAYKKAHNIKDNAALQAMFTARVQKLVTAHHKITEGWDEVLQPDTPKDVVIQSWRGRDSLLDAARRGYRALLSNGYYIDLNQPASEHYLVDPLEGIADKLTPQQTASILGGEATIWSEFVDGQNIDSRIWPRTAAIAERFWSPQSVRDLDSMYQRMAIVQQKLKSYAIDPQANRDRMIQRMAANPESLRTLQVLASVSEPPKGYEREGLKHNTALSPLNTLVDAVSPESETARSFRAIAKRIAAGTATPQDWDQARNWLQHWQAATANPQPALAQSDLTADLIPAAQSLAQLSEIGLRALDALHKHTPVPAETQSHDLQTVLAAEKPQAVLLLQVAPSIELLLKSLPAH